MPEKVSAGGLLDSLKKTFGVGQKKSPEVSVAAVTPSVVPAETSAASSVVPVLESVPTMLSPEPAATEAPPAQESAPVSGLPDWLSATPVVEPIPAAEVPEVWISPEAPTLVPEVLPALPAVEAPVAPSEAKAEFDPFATNKEFNGYMETIRQAQAVLAGGMALMPGEQGKALIAIARSNSLLPKLPPEVLESVLLMRAVASGNPKFGRDDFQMEMLAAINVIKTGTAVKG